MNGAETRFPRTHRLLSSAQFQRVFKQCRCKSGDRHFSVLAIPNEQGHSRLGLVISIRNSGNAVQRNRLKRLVRESFRQHQVALGSLDLVVLTRSGAAALDNRRIHAALAAHWQNLIKKCVD